VHILILWYITIVTWDCVPSTLLRKWRPSASWSAPDKLEGSDEEDGNFDGADDSDSEASRPFSDWVSFPSTQKASAVGHHREGSEDEEVKREVISIAGNKSICLLKFTG
jgi:hypothetical protein